MPLRLKNSDMKTFINDISGKGLYCFGSGLQPEQMCEKYGKPNIESKITAFIDNDTSKQGEYKVINGYKIPIMSLQEFMAQFDKNTVLLITSKYYYDIIKQLDKIPELDGLSTYIYIFIDRFFKPHPFKYTRGNSPKIPKKIHYCWFGGKEISGDLQSYMRSWQKFCPDYEIIRWDESNYDVTKNKYMKQAYDAKKWAFVSDYARLDIVCEHGGIYLDTDVELLRNLDDLLYDEMFCGFERTDCVAFGLGFGAVKGHRILKELLDIYEGLSFINEDGSLNLTACPYYQTKLFIEKGLLQNGRYQMIENCAIYPIDVCSPVSYSGGIRYFSENTHSIHHFAGTWLVVETDKAKNDEIAARFC